MIQELRNIIKDVPIRQITLPDGLTVHELHKEGEDVAKHIHAELIEAVPFIEIDEIPETAFINSEEALEVIHESKLLFRTPHIQYFILGNLSQDLANLKITLMAQNDIGRKERARVDLYEREAVRNLASELADIYQLSTEVVEGDLLKLIEALEQYRDKQIEQSKPQYQSKRNYLVLPPESRKECVAFLSKPNLMHSIDALIEKSGVVGEQNTRKVLFTIASTFKMPDPIHALVQGTSASGKSHLINAIGKLMPPEDMVSMTRITSKSLYHYSNDELVDKLILVQDWDGLDDEAQYAFRELQSAGSISSSTTHKDKNGNLTSAIKTVRSHFASMLATTRAEIYFDNMTRSLAVGVDESDIQTQRIIDYQNKKLAGVIDEHEEHAAQLFLQNCIRSLKPHEVINRYADKVQLPVEAKTLRRLNTHYQAFVKQITILHQYQRETDEQNRLITQPEDLVIACELLFDTLMIKIDDLDASLRQFFDSLKVYANKKVTFSQREVRLELNVSKTQCFRFFEDLTRLEYIQKIGGQANKGFKYKIAYFDDMEKMRDRIKKDLTLQLDQLK